MNAEKVKAKMDKEVEIRKLIAKLDRGLSGLQLTLNKLFSEVYNTTTSSCTVELDEEDCCADGFHGKSYDVFKEHLESVLSKEAEEESTRLDSVKEAEARSYDKDE